MGSVSSTDLILRPAEGPPLLHEFNKGRGIPGKRYLLAKRNRIERGTHFPLHFEVMMARHFRSATYPSAICCM